MFVNERLTFLTHNSQTIEYGLGLVMDGPRPSHVKIEYGRLGYVSNFQYPSMPNSTLDKGMA